MGKELNSNRKQQEKILTILYKFYYQKINEKIDWYYRLEYLLKDLELDENQKEGLMKRLRDLEAQGMVILKHFNMNGYIGWGAKISSSGLKFVEDESNAEKKEEKLFNRDFTRGFFVALTAGLLVLIAGIIISKFILKN